MAHDSIVLYVNSKDNSIIDADYRQEVLNVILAQLLQDRGIVSVPEGIIKSIDNRRRMPDVLVDFLGLRMMIEGEVSDQRDAEEQALGQLSGAWKRDLLISA